MSYLKRIRTSAAVLALGLAAAGQVNAAACGHPIDTRLDAITSGFGGNLENSRNAVSSITAENVGSLERHLEFAAFGAEEKRGAPAVTEQAIFFSEGPFLVAADRESGCEFWRHRVKDLNSLLAGPNFARSSGITWVPAEGTKPAMIVYGDFNGYVYALSALTGEEYWSEFMGTSSKHHMITGGIQYFDGKLLVPVASKEVLMAPAEPLQICCDTHGMLRMVDAYSGETIWNYETTGRARWRWWSGKKGPNGASIWGTPTVDLARGLIYVPTGQNYTRPYTNTSDAIIALKISTGAVKWKFQSTSNDAWNAACNMAFPLNAACDVEGWDFDFGAPPILADLPNGGQAIIAGAKNGVVYSLNPSNGSINWSTIIGVGGTLGGIHWGMAVDATNVYAATTDTSVNKAEVLEITSLLDIGEATAESMTPSQGARPGIYALDLMSGDLVWEKHPKSMFEGEQVDRLYSAAVTVTNDVLFAGSLNGIIEARRTSDGALLWSDDTNAAFVDVRGIPGDGGTIENAGQVVAGTDLLVNSGYNTFGGVNRWQSGPGNALIVYRLSE